MVGKANTRFSVVRYGNVIGSRGSVVPYFKSLIHKNALELPITDERMTRFWITLQEGVNFLIKNFSRMQGGEIFVPKIPSIRIVDLAKAMAPHIPINLVGIRPGEKLHEVMCPSDYAHLTLEYDDHYVLTPAIIFYARSNEFRVNQLGEAGKPVPEDFEYNSNKNPIFLSEDEITELNRKEGF